MVQISISDVFKSKRRTPQLMQAKLVEPFHFLTESIFSQTKLENNEPRLHFTIILTHAHVRVYQEETVHWTATVTSFQLQNVKARRPAVLAASYRYNGRLTKGRQIILHTLLRTGRRKCVKATEPEYRWTSPAGAELLYSFEFGGVFWATVRWSCVRITDVGNWFRKVEFLHFSFTLSYFCFCFFYTFTFVLVFALGFRCLFLLFPFFCLLVSSSLLWWSFTFSFFLYFSSSPLLCHTFVLFFLYLCICARFFFWISLLFQVILVSTVFLLFYLLISSSLFCWSFTFTFFLYYSSPPLLCHTFVLFFLRLCICSRFFIWISLLFQVILAFTVSLLFCLLVSSSLFCWSFTFTFFLYFTSPPLLCHTLFCFFCIFTFVLVFLLVLAAFLK